MPINTPIHSTMEQITSICRETVPDFQWCHHTPDDAFFTESWFLKCRQRDDDAKRGLILRLPIETIRELTVLPRHEIEQLARNMAKASVLVQRGTNYPEASISIHVILHVPSPEE